MKFSILLYKLTKSSNKFFISIVCKSFKEKSGLDIDNMFDSIQRNVIYCIKLAIDFSKIWLYNDNSQDST